MVQAVQSAQSSVVVHQDLNVRAIGGKSTGTVMPRDWGMRCGIPTHPTIRWAVPVHNLPAPLKAMITSHQYLGHAEEIHIDLPAGQTSVGTVNFMSKVAGGQLSHAVEAVLGRIDRLQAGERTWLIRELKKSGAHPMAFIGYAERRCRALAAQATKAAEKAAANGAEKPSGLGADVIAAGGQAPVTSQGAGSAALSYHLLQADEAKASFGMNQVAAALDVEPAKLRLILGSVFSKFAAKIEDKSNRELEFPEKTQAAVAIACLQPNLKFEALPKLLRQHLKAQFGKRDLADDFPHGSLIIAEADDGGALSCRLMTASERLDRQNAQAAAQSK